MAQKGCGAAGGPVLLGIESRHGSGRRLLAHVVASRADEPARFGGVVPGIAARAHLHAPTRSCVRPWTRRACGRPVDAVAVTTGPGPVRCFPGGSGRGGAPRPRGRRPAAAGSAGGWDADRGPRLQRGDCGVAAGVVVYAAGDLDAANGDRPRTGCGLEEQRTTTHG
ncbi:hypothetical protein ACFV7Q_23365 [Streptomyces sp. NPDC059851]|uniref:hypothetical protein n=1 Tax=Streptomyces sp. NPDC059851 TaxID=3346971 RepID=UPI003653F9EC